MVSNAVTKRCNGCRRTLPIEEFGVRNRASGARQSRCRKCQNDRSRAHYAGNRERYVAKARRWNEANRDEVQRLVIEYLVGHPCVDCGETDAVVLTFDHVRGEKRADVGSLVNGSYGWAVVLAEIEKCDVRCFNCHMRRTAKQYGWAKARLLALVAQ